MKKRTGLSLAGGIIQIIGAVYWFLAVLFVFYIYSMFPYEKSPFDYIQLVLPIVFLLFGIRACIGERTSNLRTYGILNIMFIALQCYDVFGLNKSSGTYIGLGVFQMSLLLVSAILFFCSKKSEYEIWYNQRLKEYTEQESKQAQKIRLMYVAFCSLGVVFIGILQSLYIAITKSFYGVSPLFIVIFILIVEIIQVILAIIIGTRKNLKCNVILSAVYGFIANVIYFIASMFERDIPISVRYVLNIFTLIFYVGIIWLTYKTQYSFELNRIIKKEEKQKAIDNADRITKQSEKKLEENTTDTNDTTAKLIKLKELFVAGVLTEEEYNNKKESLIKEL